MLPRSVSAACQSFSSSLTIVDICNNFTLFQVDFILLTKATAGIHLQQRPHTPIAFFFFFFLLFSYITRQGGAAAAAPRFLTLLSCFYFVSSFGSSVFGSSGTFVSGVPSSLGSSSSGFGASAAFCSYIAAPTFWTAAESFSASSLILSLSSLWVTALTAVTASSTSRLSSGLTLSPASLRVFSER